VGLPAYRARYNERVIDPVTQEVVKAVTARYTAVELITNREKIRTEIKELLKRGCWTTTSPWWTSPS